LAESVSQRTLECTRSSPCDPRVGIWQSADKTKDQLIFVTRKDVVDVATKTMQNIPQKHIGVYHAGNVYHYSNTEDRVVKQTVDAFYARFQKAYAGDQGLFFGEVPGSELTPTVDFAAASVPHSHAFKLRNQGTRWFAQRSDVDGEEEFLIGAEVNQPRSLPRPYSRMGPKVRSVS
jgi:hypothetical protein